MPDFTKRPQPQEPAKGRRASPEKDDAKQPVHLYTEDEAAGMLRKSRRWLREYIKQHPFYRLAGRTKVFTAADISALIEALPRPAPPYRPAAGRRSTTFSVRGRDDGYERALELINEGKQSRSIRKTSAGPRKII